MCLQAQDTEGEEAGRAYVAADHRLTLVRQRKGMGISIRASPASYGGATLQWCLI